MDNKQAARVIFDEAWNKGNVDAIDRVVSPQGHTHDPYMATYGTGADALKNMIRTYRKAFPDLKMNVEHQVGEGNFVVTHWTSTGTHKGELMGLQPTSRYGSTTGMTLHRFEGGKIVETWNNWDVLGMLQQLGASPKQVAGMGSQQPRAK